MKREVLTSTNRGVDKSKCKVWSIGAGSVTRFQYTDNRVWIAITAAVLELQLGVPRSYEVC